MFDMYTGMYDSCAMAAEQQWGSKGVFLPETLAFDGLAELPDDIAAEMRDLYLVRKPMTRGQSTLHRILARRSSRIRAGGTGGAAARWKTASGSRRSGPRRRIGRGDAHLFARREDRLPVLAAIRVSRRTRRGSATGRIRCSAASPSSIATFPNIKKGDDGKYHIHHVNSNESVRGAQRHGRGDRLDAGDLSDGDSGVGDSRRRRRDAAGVAGVSRQPGAAAAERPSRRSGDRGRSDGVAGARRPVAKIAAAGERDDLPDTGPTGFAGCRRS